MGKDLRGKDLITLRDNFHKLEDCFKEIKIELDSFCEKGNQAAAKRARKKLMEITRIAKTVRNLIQDAKINAIEYPSKNLSSPGKEKHNSDKILNRLNPKLIDLVGIDKN